MGFPIGGVRPPTRKGRLFPGQTLSESEFVQAGQPGKLDLFGNLIPRASGRLRRTEAERKAGVAGQRIDESQFIPGRRRNFEGERVPQGAAALESGVLRGAFSGIPRERQTIQQEQAAIKARLAALDPTAPSQPQFLAGRGFSLQPLGFNLALSQFQNPELFNFENRRAGGFLVGGSSDERRKFRGKRLRNRIPLPPANLQRPGDFSGEVGDPGSTLLTGRIRRQKLTQRGTVRKLETAPSVVTVNRQDTRLGGTPRPQTERVIPNTTRRQR